MTTTTPPVGQGIHDTQVACADRTQLPGGQSSVAHTQKSSAAGAPDSPPTMGKTTPMPTASADPNRPCAQSRSATTHMLTAPTDTPAGHAPPDTHRENAGGDQDHPSAIHQPAPKAHMPAGTSFPLTKARSAPNPSPSTGPGQPGHGASDTQNLPAGPLLADPVLGLFADVVDDLETVRIANANRLRQLTDTTELGHGLSTEHPEVQRLANLVEALAAAEKQAVKSLQKSMRAHPLGTWVASVTGVGEKQAARLLATIRDPYWNDLHGRPRTVSELWAYCGFHVLHTAGHTSTDPQSRSVGGVAPRRTRGEKSNWNADARQRAWLIAASCIKYEESRYRPVYDDTRAKYAEAVHATACVRCGPSGKPASPGSPLSAGHQHARALRAVAKTLLRDLWREAAAYHEQAAADA